MSDRHARLRPWFGPIAAIILIWTALILHDYQEREQALQAGRVSTANLARAFEESLIRTIREIDQTLLYVRALRSRGDGKIDLQPWIESADPANRLAAQIAIVDRDGIVTLSNLKVPGNRIDLSDRPHFRHFADAPDDHLHISPPVLGRVSHQWTIQFVRMLTTPTGAFDGIIVLSVEPETLARFYDAIDIGRDGRVTIIGTDGIIRARGGNTTGVGERSRSPILELAKTSPHGYFAATDQRDHIARIGSYQRVSGFPLVLSISMSERELRAEQIERLPRDSLIALLLTLLVLALAGSASRQRWRAAQAQELTRLALDHVGVGIMVIDPGGRIGMFNGRAVELLAMPPTIRPGIPFVDFIDWQRREGHFDPRYLAPSIADLKRGPAPWRSVPAEFRRSLPNGRVIETRSKNLEDGTIVRSFTDITDADQLERTLTEARDAAEASVAARAQFLATMSHEIRTPLNGILGAADLILATELSPEQDSFATIIRQAGTHLLEMLSNILDYSKIDQRGVELETVVFDPAGVLRDVVGILGQRADVDGLALRAEVPDSYPAQVSGDPHRLRQVLLNLVGNALKFTPSGGHIDITTRATRESDAVWRLDYAVSDTGSGIAPEALPTLFDEFTQSDGTITRRFGGTGLGLAICRRLITAMRGQIDVRSTPGTGSTFTFDIRLAATAEPATSLIAPPAADAAAWIVRRAPRVLLAEDSRVNRLVAGRMLERLGCHLQMVENGAEALAAVKQGGIDLVLMDVMMPVMDGLAATRAIRALPAPGNAVPIVGLSANAFRTDEEAGRAAGMTGFATKPIDSARLAAAIANALQHDTPALPPIDATIEHLRATLGDETAEAVIMAFRDDAPETLAMLRRHAETGNATGVGREAHALAGTAGSLGLTDLTATARALERAARTNGAIPDQAALAALEDRIAADIARLMPAMAA